MKKLTFWGFTAGSSVTLDVSQNGHNASANTGPEGWGIQSSTTSAQINLHRSNLEVAPEGMTFDVTLDGFDTPGPAAGEVYDPRLHKLYYYWDFDDLGTYASPEHILEAHRNSNVAYGPFAAHTFKAAGTYRVSVMVVEPETGKSALASIDVTVRDPNVVFAGSKTHFVDIFSNFTGAPSGATQHSNINDAMTVAKDGSTGHTRVMLRRGQPHALDGVRLRGSSENFYFCSQPGTGARAQIIPTATLSLLSAVIYDNNHYGQTPGQINDFVLHDIDVIGGYDSTTETGPTANFYVSSSDHSSYVLFSDCFFTGWALPLWNASTETGHTWIVSDCHITNWQNFGAYEVAQTHSAYIGCRITQLAAALNGGPKSGGTTHNIHGPVRIEQGGTCIVHSCDLFSRNGWFPNSPGYATCQPCFRWNQEGNTNARLNFQANHLEGGFNVLNLDRRDGAIDGVPQNIMVEKNTLIGNHMTYSLVNIDYGGVTLRNNVMIHPDAPRDVNGSFEALCFIDCHEPNEVAANAAAPIEIYNNTCINLMSDANSNDGDATVVVARNGGDGGSSFSAWVEANNILHQPNLGTPDVLFGPLDETPTFTARYTGYKSQTIDPIRTEYATPSDTIAVYAPLATSPALAAAAPGLRAIDDIYGVTRVQPPARGAAERPA